MPRAFGAVRSRVDTFDKRVDSAFDALRGRHPVDRLFYAASELGDYSLLWILLGGLRGLRSERDWNAALRLGAGLAAESFLVNAVIKSLFRRSRPPSEVERPLRVRRPKTSSFPSGHATSALVAAILLSEGDPVWPLYYGLAAIVATSRIYTKMHHASDVAAGMAVGVALGLAGRRLVPLPPVADDAQGAAARS
ncbi:MAG TPA: phosphatase PAP2 family protein [Acidimicrobiales bacterium]|nr:phosphatase PAP2 family protein [Acidimicrobiales bacterium]